MRLLVILSSFLIIFISCAKENNNFVVVKGEIKGLTKGTLYLEKVRDTSLVLVDSFMVLRNGKFEMSDTLSSPEMYYLRLKEFPEEYILFFAEPGVMTIDSKIEKLAIAAKISGSENQKLLENYKGIIRRFNDEKLGLIKGSFLAEKEQNQQKIDSMDLLLSKHIKRRYLYTANFAVKNADKEIAPYLALTELFNANIYFLDTISNSMSANNKNSFYGKKFQKFLEDVKKSEKDSLIGN